MNGKDTQYYLISVNEETGTQTIYQTISVTPSLYELDDRIDWLEIRKTVITKIVLSYLYVMII